MFIGRLAEILKELTEEEVAPILSRLNKNNTSGIQITRNEIITYLKGTEYKMTQIKKLSEDLK